MAGDCIMEKQRLCLAISSTFGVSAKEQIVLFKKADVDVFSMI